MMMNIEDNDNDYFDDDIYLDDIVECRVISDSVTMINYLVDTFSASGL